MNKLTPTQAARSYMIRNFGSFLVTMPVASQNQLIKAYVSGVRHGRNGKRNGK